MNHKKDNNGISATNQDKNKKGGKKVHSRLKEEFGVFKKFLGVTLVGLTVVFWVLSVVLFWGNMPREQEVFRMDYFEKCVFMGEIGFGAIVFLLVGPGIKTIKRAFLE